MPINCVAYGCTNQANKTKEIGYFRFPNKDEERRSKWVNACKRKNRDGSQWNPRGKNVYICGRHFISGNPVKDPQHPDHVPSVFVFSRSRISVDETKLKRYENVKKRGKVVRKEKEQPPEKRKKQNPNNNSDEFCVAYGCNKRRKKYRKDLRSDSEGSEDEESELKRKYPRQFHLFPIEPQLLKQWIVNIRRKHWFPKPGSKICSDHFKEEVLDRSWSTVRLKKNAVPTRFKALKKLLKYDGDSETCSVKLEPPKLMNIKQEP